MIAIDGFENYFVTICGKVLSNKVFSRNVKGELREMIPQWCGRGYHQVVLYKDNKAYQKSIHSLVAEAYLIKRVNKNEINHKNGIKTDNKVHNLEWATRSENIRHSYDLGLKSGLKGESNGRSKLNESDVKSIRLDTRNSKTISNEFNISESYVRAIKNFKYWKHL
jgi:hypothetical protein